MLLNIFLTCFAVKYRSRTDITYQILEAANGGTTKTKIMYRAFLSYAQLKEYLRVLVENGLLEHDKKSELFKTTEKGLRFNRLFNQLEHVSYDQEISELPST